MVDLWMEACLWSAPAKNKQEQEFALAELLLWIMIPLLLVSQVDDCQQWECLEACVVALEENRLAASNSLPDRHASGQSLQHSELKVPRSLKVSPSVPIARHYVPTRVQALLLHLQ